MSNPNKYNLRDWTEIGLIVLVLGVFMAVFFVGLTYGSG